MAWPSMLESQAVAAALVAAWWLSTAAAFLY
ncbi:hypothetical protein FHT15_002369 [Xanthomonas campestris]